MYGFSWVDAGVCVCNYLDEQKVVKQFIHRAKVILPRQVGNSFRLRL